MQYIHRNRRIAALFGLLFVWFICHTTVIACSKPDEGNGEEEAKDERPAVVTTVARHMTFEQERTYIGNIEAVKQVNVMSLVSDRITEFPWQDGDLVQKGDRLITIRHELSKSGLAQIKAQLRSIDFQIKVAKREMARAEKMYADHVISEQQFMQAKDAVNSLNLQKSQISAMKRQRNIGMQNSFINAPITGIVANKRVEVGDLSAPGVPLCTLLDLTRLKVTLNIPEAEAAKLKEGQEMTLVFSAYPTAPIAAKISRILPYVNISTRTNIVEAEFDNVALDDKGNYRYKPGMYASAHIIINRIDDAIVLPQQALLLTPELIKLNKPGQEWRKVFILSDGKAIERRIRIGIREGENVQILEGIGPSETVIIRGQHSLNNGEEVRNIKTQKIALSTDPPPAEATAQANIEKSAQANTEKSAQANAEKNTQAEKNAKTSTKENAKPNLKK